MLYFYENNPFTYYNHFTGNENIIDGQNNNQLNFVLNKIFFACINNIKIYAFLKAILMIIFHKL